LRFRTAQKQAAVKQRADTGSPAADETNLSGMTAGMQHLFPPSSAPFVISAHERLFRLSARNEHSGAGAASGSFSRKKVSVKKIITLE